MKETQFIQQKQAKWAEFENILADPRRDPDKLQDMFVQITDDLSHARTFYPSRSVRAYLNGLAQAIFGDIYKQKKSPLSKFRRFYTDDLPQVVYESRWSFLWAFLFFVLSFVIGYFSSMMDESFLRIILGDSYVEMTVENIKKGDPMAVYKSSGRFDMTFGIMANNIRVCVIYFLLGVFAGIGSVAMMMYNGIMVGAFLQFFSRHNLLAEANFTIWMHGTFEISAIVIGTAAGITMGRGLVFPGTYTRLQAFQMSARRGLKIMVGVISLLIVAALIEGNLTRHTEAGDLFRGVFIAICLVIVLGYFGWLPFYKARQGFAKPLAEAQLPPDSFYSIDYQKIKSGGEIFGDVFLLFRQQMGFYLRLAIWAALAFCTAAFFLSKEKMSDTFKLQTDIFTQHEVIRQFFLNEDIRFQPFLMGLILAALAFFIFRQILRGEGRYQQTRREEVFSFLEMFGIFTFWSLIASTNSGMLFLSVFILTPFFGLWAYTMFRFGFNFKFRQAARYTRALVTARIGLVFGAYLIMLLIAWLFYSLANSTLMYFYLWMMGWNFSFLSQNQLDEMVVIAMAFCAAFSIFTIVGLIFTTISLLFYSLLEIYEANAFLARIQQIGMGKKIRGMARE
jgi:uncharacterized membrane protein SpoIIM required for sporulation